MNCENPSYFENFQASLHYKRTILMACAAVKRLCFRIWDKQQTKLFPVSLNPTNGFKMIEISLW